MKRKCLAHEQCPLMRGYDAIGDWWSLLIVTQMILAGARRFNEFQEGLGMARNVLTDRLKKLTDQGIIEKVPASDGSAYFEYVPTEKGTDLYKVIVALRQWGEKHFPIDAKPGNSLVDRQKKKRIPNLEVRSADGRILEAEDIEVSDNKSRRRKG